MKDTKSIYIDCSYLYHHTELNTGIQRVVRKIVENFERQAVDHHYEARPVIIRNGAFQPISARDLYPPAAPATEAKQSRSDLRRARLKSYVEHVYGASLALLYAIFPFQRVHRFLFTPKESFGLNFILYRLFFQPFQPKRVSEPGQAAKSIAFAQGDVLLLADSTWYMDIWPSVAQAKRQGARIIAVIYDLIPITHSQYCDALLVEVFKKWFFDSLDYVEGYITISNTVKQDLQAFMRREFGAKTDTKGFDFFLLGSDFHHDVNHEQHIRPDLVEPLSSRPTYLIVCTVEPRKNHWYLLDVFDRLWEKDIDVNLCIVGRVGWKIEKTMNRILNHPQLNERLFYFHDLNDKELGYCYEVAKMLLFPSVVEGFGLPIVESLMHRLPVLASDTPIHREVGGEDIGYFDIGDPASLVGKILEIEKDGIPESLRVDHAYSWLSWSDSTELLLTRTLRLAAPDALALAN